MRFKLRSTLVDSQTFELSIEEKEEDVKAAIEKNNDKKESMTLFQNFIRSKNEKTIIAPNDIDKNKRNWSEIFTMVDGKNVLLQK